MIWGTGIRSSGIFLEGRAGGEIKSGCSTARACWSGEMTIVHDKFFFLRI